MKKTNISPASPFIECVELLITTMKTPGELLMFLLETLDTARSLPTDKAMGLCGYLFSLGEYVLLPWISGSDTRAVDMEKGFKYIFDMDGAEPYREATSKMVYIAIEHMEHGFPEPCIERFKTGFEVMQEVGRLFYKYENTNQD